MAVMEERSTFLTNFIDNLFDDDDDELLLLKSGDDLDDCSVAVLNVDRRNKIRIEEYFENVIDLYSMDDFRSHFRMSRSAVDTLVPLLVRQGKMPVLHIHGKEPIDQTKQCLVGIWCLSNQEVYRSVADRFDITMSSTYRCFLRVMKSLQSMLKDFIKWPRGTRVYDIFEAFREKRGIPQILGALDGCHIRIKTPEHHPAVYVNRKRFHSIVLQAVCDDKMSFTDVYVGWPGSVHDARVLRNSELFHRAEELFPADSHLLGDAAYPLENWLMTPYKDNGHLTRQQSIFNTRHASCRCVIERAFGLLKGRWRKLQYLDVTSAETICIIITAACVLHNFTLAYDGEDVEDFVNAYPGNQEVPTPVVEQPTRRCATDKRNRLANIQI